MGGVAGCQCSRLEAQDRDGGIIDAEPVLEEDEAPLYDEPACKQVVTRPCSRFVRRASDPGAKDSRVQRRSVLMQDPVDQSFGDAEPDTDTFQISLDKTYDSVGVDVDCSRDKELPVTNVRNGLIDKWNQANPEAQVLPGDVMVEVNGVKQDVVRMLRRLNADKVLKVKVRRSSGSHAASSSGPPAVRTRHYEYLLVGGGVAAGYACRELVQNGVARGAVAIMAGEDVPPYERPALTKAYLHPPDAKMRARLPGFHCCVGSGGERQEAAWYSEKGITFLEGPASAVDFTKKTVKSETGVEVTYGKLILATGCRPNSLQIPGINLDGVHYVREENDCAEIVNRLERLHGESSTDSVKRKVLVVGGGYIGMEVAAALLGWNLEVHWIFPERHALPRLFDATMAEWLEAQFTSRGGKITKGCQLEEFSGEQGVVKRVRLKSGTELPCDIVIIGVGAAPNVEFCTGLNMVKGGFQVDSMMETSQPGVYAVGDICAFPSKSGGHRRHEHVDHARKSAVQAVRAALQLAPPPYDYLPYFYSRIFEYTEAPIVLNCYGEHSGKCQSLVRKKSSVAAMWVKGGKVVGSLLMSSPGPTSEEQEKLRALAAAQPKASDIASVFKDAGL